MEFLVEVELDALANAEAWASARLADTGHLVLSGEVLRMGRARAIGLICA